MQFTQFSHNAICGREKAITAGGADSARREWILSVGLLKKSNSLLPIKMNANSASATPSERDFEGGKSAAVPIQAKPLMIKKRKEEKASKEADSGNALVKHLRSTTESSGAEPRGPPCAFSASCSSNFESRATETLVLAAALHIYGDSASFLCLAESSGFVCGCVSVRECSQLSAHGPSTTRRRKSNTIDFLATQV